MLLISRVTMFFLLDYGDHLDLHSFPTRRSSDLALALRFSARRTTRLRCNTDSNGACNGILIRPLSPFVADHEREQATNKSGDRKSTRLNSSHMSNSYAVFCLKKKKNTLYQDHHI